MNKPVLAVVIPCYNEELCINNTVERLFEVLSDLVLKGKISENIILPRKGGNII